MTTTANTTFHRLGTSYYAVMHGSGPGTCGVQVGKVWKRGNGDWCWKTPAGRNDGGCGTRAHAARILVRLYNNEDKSNKHYTELPMPVEGGDNPKYPGGRKVNWRDIEEAARLRKSFKRDTHVVDGVLRWKSNNAVVPPHVMADAFCVPTSAHASAYEREMDRFMMDYKAARAKRSPEQIAEERAEARAAHGPGVKLVDVLTGETYTT